MAPSFLLDLQNLDAAGKSLQQPITKEWLTRALDGCEGEIEPGEGEGRVDIRYSRSGADLIVHGRVQATVQVPCSRCLQPVDLPINTDLSLLLVPASDAKAEFARGRKGGPGAKKKPDGDKGAAAKAGAAATAKERPAATNKPGAFGRTGDKPGAANKAAAPGDKKRPRDDEGDEFEFTSGDADLDVYSGDEVALDPFVREALLLEVPPFVLCKEDCRGIAPPPPSGEDVDQEASIDPRLAPLLRFKKPGSS